MSDFDKEAEREKLREKYERDQADREATQRMSDLLLKGATMTNTHCGTCGDPLFRQNGATFCPSCHGSAEAVDGTGLEGGEAAASSDSGDSASDASADASSSTELGVQTPSRSDDESASDQTGAATGDASNPDSNADDARASPSPDQRREPRPSRRSQEPRRGSDSSTPQRPASSRSADGDLEVARDSLVRALERFAREAAETDDPRYAKECLEAAREAGESLATLERQ